MTKQERIKRKLQRAQALAVEAHGIAGEISTLVGLMSDEQRITGAALDRANDTLRDWENLERRWRERAAAIIAEHRRLEEFGRCTKCNTGAPADHRHCKRCGWSMYAFGSRAEQCHNDQCELYECEQEGIRYAADE